MASSVKQIVEFNYDVRIPTLVSPYSRKETTNIFSCSDTLTFPLILDILPIRIHSVNPVGIEALAARADAELIWSPVLLGAIYKQTAAPQGAAGSASDVFNPAKKSVSSRAFARTIKRYRVPFQQPTKHPQKTTSALQLLYCVPNEERARLTHALFKAYWFHNKDISDRSVVLDVARQSGIASASKLSGAVFSHSNLRDALRTATADAVARGAPGVPSFWIPGETWTDVKGKACKGRLYWGQDRMHFVEAVLIALKQGIDYHQIADVGGLQPRCLRVSQVPKAKTPTRLELWYDFSSPWAFLGWTQLERMKREADGGLEIEMKPILLGALFRLIGSPMVPMLAMSLQKLAYTRQDQADWVRHWNAINIQQEGSEKPIELRFPDVFPIRSPMLLRIAMVEPKTIPVLFRACWEQNIDVTNAKTLVSHLSASGFNGADLLQKASQQRLKDQLRANTDQARELGLCGVPTYRVLEATSQDGWVVKGSLVWGQDELGVVQDLVAGWREEDSRVVADVSMTHQSGNVQAGPASKANEEEVMVEGAAPAKPML